MNLQQLDWSLWRSFLAILRAGSLAAAARDLDVTHPTIRRHLEELETQIGAPLFIRSPSGLAATELALDLRDGALAMESAAGLLARRASADAIAVAGTVRITASEIMGVEVLPPILARVKKWHPGLSFELTASNAIVDVLRHDADIAVRMTRPAQDGLVARKVGLLPLGLYAHENWIALHQKPAALPDLIGAGAMIGCDRDTSLLRGLEELGVRARPADFCFRSDSDLAQLAALRAGLGVGICMKALAARTPGLKPVLPDFVHSLEVWLVTHPSLRATPRVRTVLDELAGGIAAFIEG